MVWGQGLQFENRAGAREGDFASRVAGSHEIAPLTPPRCGESCAESDHASLDSPNETPSIDSHASPHSSSELDLDGGAVEQGGVSQTNGCEGGDGSEGGRSRTQMEGGADELRLDAPIGECSVTLELQTNITDVTTRDLDHSVKTPTDGPSHLSDGGCTAPGLATFEPASVPAAPSAVPRPFASSLGESAGSENGGTVQRASTSVEVAPRQASLAASSSGGRSSSGITGGDIWAGLRRMGRAPKASPTTTTSSK